MKEFLFYLLFLYLILHFTKPPHLFSERGCSREVSVEAILPKNNKGPHFSGLIVNKKPLGLYSPSTKMLFLNLVWNPLRSLMLPPDPSEEEDGTQQALALTRSPDTDQGSLSHMRNGL